MKLKLKNEERREAVKKSNRKNRAEKRGMSDATLKYPTIKDLRWRVDVSISTSSMARTMNPLVVCHITNIIQTSFKSSNNIHKQLMEMTLSDGRVWTFEVPQDKFHELRYNVAKVLQEVEQLDKLPILKIKTSAGNL